MTFDINSIKGEWSGTVYIRADGSIDPQDAPIERYGDLYVFAGNISGSIRVEKSNIVIDGRGNTLSGAGSGVGIDLSQMEKVFVRSTIINNFSYGIRLNYSYNNIIGGNGLLNCEYGIFLEHSSSNIIRGNIILNNSYGIFGSSFNNNTISGNRIGGNKNAISLLYSSGNTIYLNYVLYNDNGTLLRNSVNNTISGNYITNNQGIYALYLLYASNTTISGNHIVSNGDNGILLICSDFNTLSENNITDNFYGLQLDSSCNNVISQNNITENVYGIQLRRSSNYNYIGGNIITDNNEGISVYSSYNIITGNCIWRNEDYGILVSWGNNLVSGNSIANSDYGIYLDSADDNVIRGNGIGAGNGQGIYLSSSFGNTIIGNGISRNGNGITLSYSDRNNISRNDIRKNENSGFYIYYSDENIFTGNNITENGIFGIWFWSSSYNLFYHNNFVNNGLQQVNIVPGECYANRWDNGYPSGGNYWSDYTGIDEKNGPDQDQPGSDGIGDEVQYVDEGNLDYYPLMNPWTPPLSWRVISFDVFYGGINYNVFLNVSSAAYEYLLKGAEKARNSLFPNFNKSLFANSYYLYYYNAAPDMFPVFNVSVYKDGSPVTDNKIKAAVVNGLLEYCEVLLSGTWPDMLNNWRMQYKGWLKLYIDKAYLVTVSNTLSEITYLLTIIGPILESIKNLFGEATSDVVEAEISLFFSLHGGYTSLKERYGALKADAIVNILIGHGYISEKDYNSMQLYKKLIENPEASIQVIEEIGEQVLDLEFNSNAHSLMLNFVNEIKSGVIGDFTVGAATGLLAYFGHGLTASTALKIGLSKAFESFVGGTIPLSLANALHQSYITPMAKALNEAWESAGQAAEAYFNLYLYGNRIAAPIGDKFNLSEAETFAAAYGFACLSEFRYYTYSYFYRSRQLFVPKSELAMLKENAHTMFNRAVDWASRLAKILELSKGLVSENDPPSESAMLISGAINYEDPMSHGIPPINVFPDILSGLEGFAVICNSSPKITLNSTTYTFEFQNEMWASNFPYSFYIDDPYGYSYFIIFAPPEQHYKVSSQNETIFHLKNFETENETITITDAGSITSTEIYFNVKNSQIDPETVITEFPSVTVLLLIMSITLIAVILTRKKKNNNRDKLQGQKFCRKYISCLWNNILTAFESS